MIRCLKAWLNIAGPAAESDLIFVLAGRVGRKLYALDLFAHGFAPALLLSVARFEIRRFPELPLPIPINLSAMASSVPPAQRHLFVWFSNTKVRVHRVYKGWLGTWSEVQALARCLEAESAVRSIAVLSDGYHLRRLKMCCHSLLPPRVHLRFVAVQDTYGPEGKRRPSERETLVVLSELAKLVIYRALFAIGYARLYRWWARQNTLDT